MSKKKEMNKTVVFQFPHPFIRKTEFIAGAMLALTAIFFHFLFLRHAGAFWRDEVNSIAMATMPSLSDTWYHLRYDSFPMLLSVVLRPWIWIVRGNELGIRVFGFLVGVSMLGALWLNGRWLGYRVPLLSVALFVFHPLSLQIGDSIRPYGVGILLMLLTFGLAWKVTEQARPWQIAAGTIVAILSVQCLYQNAFFVLAVIVAGIIITLRDKRWERAVLLAAMGMAAAVSLLPYYQSIKKSSDWSMIIKSPIDFPLIWDTLCETLNVSGWITFKFWIGLFILGTCVFIYFQVVRLNSAISRPRKDVALFCAATVMIYAVLYLFFLRFVCVTVRAWYYLPLMAAAAVLLDVMFCGLNRWNVLRIVLAILAAAATFGAGWKTAHVRQTNMDVVASTLEKSAGKDDLIIVNPWYLAVSFQRYYHGPASFTTLPPIEDHKVHRYDLLKAKMASIDPVGPVLSEISRTLKSGGSVWIVGGLNIPPKNDLPQMLPPAPYGIYGWAESAYTDTWSRYVGYYIVSHGITDQIMTPGMDKPVNPYETCPIVNVQGWQ